MKTSSRVENLTQPRQGQIIFEIVLVVDIEIRPDLLFGESFWNGDFVKLAVRFFIEFGHEMNA